jgi:hypothetical protein
MLQDLERSSVSRFYCCAAASSAEVVCKALDRPVTVGDEGLCSPRCRNLRVDLSRFSASDLPSSPLSAIEPPDATCRELPLRPTTAVDPPVLVLAIFQHAAAYRRKIVAALAGDPQATLEDAVVRFPVRTRKPHAMHSNVL